MSIRNQMILGSTVSLLFAFQVHAADLNGAWANDLSVCSKIFVNKNNQMSFADNSDFYGSGFIINGNDIIGKAGKCRVTSRKIQENKIQLAAECATDIALSSDRFSLRVDSDDKITRLFPSMPGMEMQYYRCPR